MHDITAQITEDIDGKITNAEWMRRACSDAEAEHYRQMNRAGQMVEAYQHDVDDLLEARHDLTAPADPEAVAAAWAGLVGDPSPDPDATKAREAVAFLVSLIPARPGIIELPGLIQDEHGCWVTDDADPTCLAYPEARMGCAVAW